MKKHTITGDAMKMIQRIYHLVVDTKIPTLSGSVCFFLLVNGGSYLFLFVSISSYFFLDIEPFLQQNLSDGIGKDILLYLIEHNAGMSISVFLLASSIYSSSSLYYHFMHICELITKQAVDNRLGKRLQSLILVPFVLVCIFILFILISYLQLIIGNISYIFYIIFSFLFLYFLNRIALRGYSFKRLYKGIVFSLFYSIFFSLFFVLYLRIFSNFKVVYGLLSFIIIFLFYLYSITIGVFIGIYINCKNLEVSSFLFDSK